MSYNALYVDAAMMQFDDSLDDCQPQARPPFLEFLRRARPVKPLENVGEIILADADAGIGDRSDYRVSFTRRLYPNRAVGRGYSSSHSR